MKEAENGVSSLMFDPHSTEQVIYQGATSAIQSQAKGTIHGSCHMSMCISRGEEVSGIMKWNEPGRQTRERQVSCLRWPNNHRDNLIITHCERETVNLPRSKQNKDKKKTKQERKKKKKKHVINACTYCMLTHISSLILGL